MTQAALYNPTPQPNATFKPADKLIIKTVNFDKSGAISEIITFVPAAIADGQVTINGQPVESQKTQKDTTFTLSFLVPDSAPAEICYLYHCERWETGCHLRNGQYRFACSYGRLYLLN